MNYFKSHYFLFKYRRFGGVFKLSECLGMVNRSDINSIISKNNHNLYYYGFVDHPNSNPTGNTRLVYVNLCHKGGSFDENLVYVNELKEMAQKYIRESKIDVIINN